MDSTFSQLCEPYFETFESYFSTFGLNPKNPPLSFGRSGTYLELNPDLGTGYCWIYPVGDLYAVSIQEFVFRDNFVFKYGTPEFMGIGCYGYEIAKAACDRLFPLTEKLMGYVGHEGLKKQEIKKNSLISAIFISFLPEFYKKYLPQRFNVDSEEIKETLSKLESNVTIPEVEISLRQIRSARPSPAIEAMYYESKVLEIVSLMLQWKDRRKISLRKASLPEWDLENLSKIRHFLNKHYAGPISLDVLAKKARMSKSKLTGSFKQLYGMTITEHLQHLRIEKAKDLLMNSDCDIGRVANEVGYKHHASFSVLFKRITGFSPNQFRNG